MTSVIASLQRIDVLNIFWPSGSLLRRDQIGQRQNVKLLLLIGHDLSSDPHIIKFNAGRLGLNIDADTVVEDRHIVRKNILDRSHGCRAKPSICESVQQAPRVLGRRLDQHVEVECRAWHAVQDGGNSADDDVFHVMLL